MAQQITAKKLAKNMIVSVAAQAVTLLVSFILYLVVPRYVSEYTYSYWQMYMLYIAYVGVLHFGLLDGLVLRYGAYDYNELDRSRIRSQFMMLLFMLSCFAVLLGVTSLFVFEGERRFVFLLVAVGIVTKSDMFRILLELFGARHYGVRLSFLVEDKPGTIAQISAALAAKGWDIISFGTFEGTDPTNAICTIKVQGCSIDELVGVIKPFVSEILDIREV